MYVNNGARVGFVLRTGSQFFLLKQGSHSHGKAIKKSCHGKSWKGRGKWAEKIKVMEIIKYPEKSWNFFTADHESRTSSSDNSISTCLLQ